MIVNVRSLEAAKLGSVSQEVINLDFELSFEK